MTSSLVTNADLCIWLRLTTSNKWIRRQWRWRFSEQWHFAHGRILYQGLYGLLHSNERSRRFANPAPPSPDITQKLLLLTDRQTDRRAWRTGKQLCVRGRAATDERRALTGKQRGMALISQFVPNDILQCTPLYQPVQALDSWESPPAPNEARRDSATFWTARRLQPRNLSGVSILTQRTQRIYELTEFTKLPTQRNDVIIGQANHRRQRRRRMPLARCQAVADTREIIEIKPDLHHTLHSK